MRHRVGVLALQGAYASHRDALSRCGVDVVLVRRPNDLIDLDGIVVPGGESTTMSKLLSSSELVRPLRNRLDDGLALFGTCAGLILAATSIEDGRDDQIHFDAIPMTVRRNAYGRQIDSFETDVDIEGLMPSFHAVFIRAPMIVDVGTDVEILASFDGRPVLVRQGNRLACSFHPELTDDVRIHQMFVESLSPSTHVTR